MRIWNILKNRLALHKIGLIVFCLVFIITMGLPFEMTRLVPKILLSILTIYILGYFIATKTVSHIFETRIKKIVVFYLAARSVSVVNAIHILTFLSAYQRFVFGVLTFFIASFFSKRKEYSNAIFSVFILSTVINILFDHLLYFFPTITLSFLKLVYISEAFEFIKANYSRGRIYFSFFNELAIPVLIYYYSLLQKKRELDGKTDIIKKIAIISCLLFILSSAFITNWRIKILDFAFAFFISILFFGNVFKSKKIYIHIMIVVLLFFAYMSLLSLNAGQSSVVNRVLSIAKDDGETRNLGSRINSWQKTLELTKAFPLFGIGFGNFQYYFSTQIRNLRSNFANNNSLNIGFFNSPHNILFTNLVEGGLLGFGGFILLMYYLIKQDYHIARNPTKKASSVVFMIQFWTLMLYSLVHPTDFNSYFFLFFLLRGSIDGLNINLDSE